MDKRRQQSKDSLSYSNLFNLESLMNFKLPQQDDDFDYYGNSSQDESRGSQGGARVNYSNGTMSDLGKMKRRSHNSDEEDEDGYYGTHMTEEKYRSMLGKHIQKYKRRFKDTPAAPIPHRMGIPAPKSNVGGSKTRKLGNEQRGGLYEMETTSEWLNDISPQRPMNYQEAEFTPKYGADTFAYPFVALAI